MSRFQVGLLLLLISGAAMAAAEPPPVVSSGTPIPAAFSLWEAGVAGGGGYLPDYPAADQNHAKGIAVPFFTYRGRILRADRQGARAQLLNSKVYAIDIGVAGSFASRSRDNRAREGMPDLDYLLEVGPRFGFILTDFRGRGKLQVFLPLRSVFSTDLGDFRHRGFTLTPSLNGRVRLGKRDDRLLISQLTANFGNRQLSAYFYDVAPEFARPDRPFYDAKGGYIGSDLFTGVLYALTDRFRFFSGVQVLVHSGAANEASPLFKNRVNYSLATGIVWMFYRSRKPAVFLE